MCVKLQLEVMNKQLFVDCCVSMR